MLDNRSRKTLALGFAFALATFGTVADAQTAPPAVAADPKGVEVLNRVEGRTMLLKITPEGEVVTKGEPLCELDASQLKDKLTNLQIVVAGSKAKYQNAKLTREVADLGLNEYTEAIYPQELLSLNGQIAAADTARRGAEERLAEIMKTKAKGVTSDGTVAAAKLALQKANFRYEQAVTKKAVLEKYTKEKTVKKLQAEVEKARGQETALRLAYEVEVAAADRVETQIKNCKVVAPADGRVAYGPKVEEGVVLRENQLIARVVPLPANPAKKGAKP